MTRRAAQGHRPAGPAPGRWALVRWTLRGWTLGVRLAAVGFLLIVPIHAAPAAEPGVVILEGGAEEVRPEAEPPEAAVRPMQSGGLQPGARTVVPLDKFRDTQLSVADVLREVPGVTVVRTGDALSPTRVRIRGSRPDQVLILLDGVPLSAVTDHPAQGRLEGRQGVDLAALPIDRVESIEIVRGAASSLYGPDAAAGAIIIRTRRGAEEGVVAERTVGPAGFRKSRVRWVKPFGESTLTLEAAQKRSDGEYVFFLPDAGQATVATTPEAELCAPRLGGGFRLRRCNRKTVHHFALGLRRGKFQAWSFDFQQREREGLGGALNPRPFGTETVRSTTLAYSDAWPVERENRVGLDLSARRVKGERNENVTAATGVLRNDHRDRRAIADLWYEHWIARHQLRGGGALNEEKLEDRFFAATRRIGSVYGQWLWHQDRGTVEGSTRRDALSDRGEETTYRLGASRFLTTHVGVKGSQATGFRPPTLYELYDPGSTLGPSAANSELLAERSRSADGGLFAEVGDLFYGELLAFRQSVREEIVALADPASPLLFRFQNLSRTRATGWELALNFRFPARISLDVSATRIEALILENDRNDPRDNGNRVPGVAELTWTLGLAWRREAWHTYLNLRSVSERFIDTANTRFLNGYRVADAGFGFPIGGRFEGALEGRNLTNETYAEVENFPPPGRQLFFTLRWRYGAETEEKPPRPGEER